MRRWLGLALVGALALLALAPAAAQDAVTIEFVHIFGGDGDTRADVIRAMADRFEAENPGITVEIRSLSTDYTETFNAALLAADQGRAPHVVQVEEGLTQLAADSGFFLPIGSLASAEQLAQLEGILPVVRDYYTIGEDVWSVPWNSSNPIVYYNKTLTDLLQVQIPADRPLTFDEVSAACEKIMAAKTIIQRLVPGFTACANWPMVAWFPEQWLAMQDALMANNDNGRSARATEMFYDSPEMLRVVEWWKSLADNGYYTYTGTPNNYNGEGSLFGTGASAIHINSTAGITLFVAGFAQAGVKMGIAPLFVPGEDADNGVTMGGASLWVTGGHSDAETQAAVDFIFFMTQPENDILFHQGSGYFPNRTDSIEYLSRAGLFADADGNPIGRDGQPVEDGEWLTLLATGNLWLGALGAPPVDGAVEVSWFETFPFFRVAIDQLANSRGTVANAGAVVGPSAEVRSILVQALQSVVDGGIAPAEALAAAKQRADAVLADYNALVGN